MNISVGHIDALQPTTPLLAFGAWEGAPLPEAQASLIETDDWAGSFKQTLLIDLRGALPARHMLLEGLQASAERLAETATAGLRTRECQRKRYALALAAADRLAPGDKAQAIARALMLARHLANGPGNTITLAALADAARDLGARADITVAVLGQPELREQGFGWIIGVGQAAAQPPCFIILEYGAAQPGAPSICLVGKAIMSNTGGISIKPADKLDEMKTDLSGAGDLLKTLSELTIQVINTGAEGRIVLADALFYAQRFAPAALSHVVGSYPWVDMDIAGTVWADTRTRAHIPKSATGVGVRLLTQRLQTWAEAHR